MGKFSIDEAKQIQKICRGTDNIVTACERAYELGFLEGKIAGIRKAEEIFEPVHSALDKDKSNAY